MNVFAAKTFSITKLFFVIAAFTSVFSSCVTRYPKKPFVYDYKITILPKNTYSPEEKKVLEDQLSQQLHDSIRVRRKWVFFFKVLKNPPVFDSANMNTSQRYMDNSLHTLGYLRDSIRWTYSIDTVGDQYRVATNFNVYPNKLFKLDSIWYNLLDSVPYTPRLDTLQKLTINSLNETVIHKGDPFSQYLISSELDRIADIARNNGYLKFGKEQLLAVWDTVGRSILRPTTDITEQLKQLEELRKRRENPMADIEIRLRGNLDTSRITRYYIGDVRIYPDTDIDTALNDLGKKKIDTLTRYHYQFISYKNLFKSRKLIHFVVPYLKRGELYSQTNYLKVQSRFSNITAWRLATINPLPRPGTDSVDFDILLVPAKKYSASINFDVSKNQGNLVAEGNLLGLGSNLTFVNKNFAKAANRTTTNFRYGVELSTKINSIQTQQYALSHTIEFPRVVPRLQGVVGPEAREFSRTFLTTNAWYTDRFDYYRVLTLNGSWAYEFSWKKSILSIRLPLTNIEYNFLERRDSLKKLIENNQSYKYIFNDGLIVSMLGNWSNVNTKKYSTRALRISGEFSNIPGFLHSLFPSTNVYRFVKFDGEYTKVWKTGARKRSALAGRFFGGIGYALPFSRADGKPDSTNFWLPFFRQYFAGGPNSMRAWSLRKLGPGSTIKSFAKDTAPDRFGDMRLEFNFEWRIYLTQLLGAYPMETALFTDMGNVWFIRNNDNFPNGNFVLNRLPKDLAIGVGTGLRIDFGFLLTRFDFAWKAKDPSPSDPAAQNKWFYHWRPGFKSRYGAQFQLGINYPF